MQNNNVTYFDSFGVEHIPEEIKAFIKNNKNITANIFSIRAFIDNNKNITAIFSEYKHMIR